MPASALERRTEHFTILAPASREKVADELYETCEKVLEDVALQLGVWDRGDGPPIEHGPLMVRVFDSEAGLAQAMPHSSVTEWAAGIAFPRDSLILLKVDHQTMFDIHDVFRHEVSHVILGRAALHKHLPHWFLEGVAVLQAGERVRERWSKTATASLTDSVPPLSTLEHGFPGDGTRVDLAYAQSTAFVAWLVDRRGWPAIRRLLVQIRAGKTFDQAFLKIYREPLHVLERQWRRDVRASTSWFTLFVDSSLLWMIAIVLVIFAGLTVKVRRAERLRQMEDPLDLDDEFA